VTNMTKDNDDQCSHRNTSRQATKKRQDVQAPPFPTTCIPLAPAVPACTAGSGSGRETLSGNGIVPVSAVHLVPSALSFRGGDAAKPMISKLRFSTALIAASLLRGMRPNVAEVKPYQHSINLAHCLRLRSESFQASEKVGSWTRKKRKEDGARVPHGRGVRRVINDPQSLSRHVGLCDLSKDGWNGHISAIYSVSSNRECLILY